MEILLPQEKAHESNISMIVIHNCDSKTLNHSPYNPNLALFDYYLFRNMKKELRGKKFRNHKKSLQFRPILIKIKHLFL